MTSALVLVPHGSTKGAIVAAGSLAILHGRLGVPRPSQAAISHGSGEGGAADANPFPWGWCTYGAWQEAPWLGHAVWGNANAWADEAQKSGLAVGQKPIAGSVFVRTSGWLGHVGVVTGIIDATHFATIEMNGGSLLPSPPNPYGHTTEFGRVVNHQNEQTGPDMYFIYKPGTEKSFEGSIVQWDGDTKAQKTAWLVKGGLRYWIPDIGTYDCLKNEGVPGPIALPGALLDRLPDQTGQKAPCGSLQGGGNVQPGGGNPQQGGSGNLQGPGSGGGTSGGGTSGGGGTSAGTGAGGGGAPPPDTTAPSTPGGFAQIDNSQTAVRVAWNPSTDNVGVAGYDLYLNGSNVASNATSSYVIGGLSCGKSYTASIDAYDAAGNHSAQASIAASTVACPAPAPAPAPKGFHIEDDYYGGTWARTDPNNGTWYPRSSPPPNGAYWYPNGLGVGVDCARTAAPYVVKFADGHTETWTTWLHVTDGKWYPSAATQEVFNNSFYGLPPC